MKIIEFASTYSRFKISNIAINRDPSFHCVAEGYCGAAAITL